MLPVKDEFIYLTHLNLISTIGKLSVEQTNKTFTYIIQGYFVSYFGIRTMFLNRKDKTYGAIYKKAPQYVNDIKVGAV